MCVGQMISLYSRFFAMVPSTCLLSSLPYLHVACVCHSFLICFPVCPGSNLYSLINGGFDIVTYVSG